jgi:sugar-specific transcriptional regulator TrmB
MDHEKRHALERRVLEKLGLSGTETAAYLALMGAGTATAGQVAKECGLHRRNAYDALEKLVRRGLVGQAGNGGVRHFCAPDPARLLGMLRERRQEFEEDEKGLESVMDDLYRSRLSKGGQDVGIFFGREGRRVVFEGILKEKENCLLGGYAPTPRHSSYMRQWHRRRVRAGVADRIIFNKPHPFIGFLKGLGLTEVRLMPREVGSNVSFNVYGNHVGMLFWTGSTPVTIVIENGKVADDLRGYFNLIWELSSPA